mmetsp:Transcript_57927/g.126959  ORF Transcript_57927/g.126959 Transcript_57927/m.126959 type:complete len:568 (-) Transcript_57927:516-2219(-)
MMQVMSLKLFSSKEKNAADGCAATATAATCGPFLSLRPDHHLDSDSDSNWDLATMSGGFDTRDVEADNCHHDSTYSHSRKQASRVQRSLGAVAVTFIVVVVVVVVVVVSCAACRDSSSNSSTASMAAAAAAASNSGGVTSPAGDGQGMLMWHPRNGLEELFSLRLGGQQYHLATPSSESLSQNHFGTGVNMSNIRENVATLAAAGVATSQDAQIRNVGKPALADCALSANLVVVMLARFGTRVGRAVWKCRPEKLISYKANLTCAVFLTTSFNTLARAAANMQMAIANCDPTSYQEDAQCGAKVAKTLGDVAVMTAVSANLDMHCKPFPKPMDPEKSESYPDFSKMNQEQLDFYRMNKVDCGLDIWAASMKAGKSVVAGVGYKNNCVEDGFEGCAFGDTAETCHEKIRNYTIKQTFPCTRQETCSSGDTPWMCEQKVNVCHLSQARKPVQCAALAAGSVFQSLVSTSLIALASGRCAPQSNHLPQCVFAMVRIPSLLGSFVHSALTMHLQCGKAGKELKYMDYVQTLEYVQAEKEDAELKMEEVKDLKEKIESLHLFDHEKDEVLEG